MKNYTLNDLPIVATMSGENVYLSKEPEKYSEFKKAIIVTPKNFWLDLIADKRIELKYN